uniref:hypothetical protein n=1 Tax=Agathobacter sp. TaxID=2021311 RepID=UPI00405666DE
MSRYYSFNDYMNDVLEECDSICKVRHNCGLEDLYRVSRTTYRAVMQLIAKDWKVFIAVAVGLLILGPVGLTVAIGPFLSTPIGWAIVAVLGGGTVGVIKQMYHDRQLPNAVKTVGEKYKPRWEHIEGNAYQIDCLVKEAAEELYKMARS